MFALITFGLASAVIILASASKHKAKIQSAANRVLPKSRLIPQGIMFFVLVTHFGEMTKAVAHASPTSIVATLFLFTIWVATKRRSEEGLD